MRMAFGSAKGQHLIRSSEADASLSDMELVSAAQRGDRAAMVALYRRYVGELYGYALGQLGSVQDAEDLTSETFLRLVGRIASFKGDSSFRTWIYAVMRNQIRDHWRANGRRPEQTLVPIAEFEAARNGSGSVEADLLEPDHGGSGDTPPSTALSQQVMAALPERYGQVLQLRIMDGRSIRDTAEEMGTTPGNVKVLQHRALKRASRVAADIEGSSLEGRDCDDA